MGKIEQQAIMSAKYQGAEKCHQDLNYWRESYRYWRTALGRANRTRREKADIMRSLNRARTQLRIYIRANEIILGR